MQYFKYIICNSQVLGGKPIIKNTRISVAFILELVQSGASVQDIVDTYSHLNKEAVTEAITYAMAQLKNDFIYETAVAA